MTRLIPLVALLIAPSLLAAPRPLRNTDHPKPAQMSADDLCGSWRLLWCGTKGNCTIYKNGTWVCNWEGQMWSGSWVLKDGVFSVMEAPSAAIIRGIGDWYTWGARLDRGKRGGVLTSGEGLRMDLLPVEGPEKLKMPRGEKD